MKYRAPRIWLGKRSFYAVRRTRMISALSKCKAVLALSGTVRNAAVQAGFDSKNIQLWLTGIDTSRLHPLNRGSQPPRLPIRFGYTGTLSAQKGIDVILKAFQILPPEIARNTLLYVYGGLNKHPSSNGLNRLLTRYSHPSVTFMGAFTQHSLPDIQQSLDVVIVPSTWYENRPLSILESFAAGNPVVCSNLGGLSELVETSGAGWTFASGNHSQLANVIQAIVSDPDDIVIRRHAIPVVPSIDEEALKLVDLYQQS